MSAAEVWHSLMCVKRLVFMSVSRMLQILSCHNSHGCHFVVSWYHSAILPSTFDSFLAFVSNPLFLYMANRSGGLTAKMLINKNFVEHTLIAVSCIMPERYYQELN